MYVAPSNETGVNWRHVICVPLLQNDRLDFILPFLLAGGPFKSQKRRCCSDPGKQRWWATWMSGKRFQGLQLSGTVLARQWGSTIPIQTGFLFLFLSSTQSLFASDSFKLLQGGRSSPYDLPEAFVSALVVISLWCFAKILPSIEIPPNKENGFIDCECSHKLCGTKLRGE